MTNGPEVRNDESAQAASSRKRLPSWLKRPIVHANRHKSVVSCLDTAHLHTVCTEAKCPNRSDCYSRGTATFLIMGNVCTRHCRFCTVNHGLPIPLDHQEGDRLADAVVSMNLQYVVITSVTRDDLPDGGASHFAYVVECVRSKAPQCKVEVLVPDFQGDMDALDTVLKSKPVVFNHNIETVPRLYSKIRSQADYKRSLYVLSEASKRCPDMLTKSGLMVGLGETEDEVVVVMKDLRSAGVSILTIGQYLQPSDSQVPVEEFVTPEQFVRYNELGMQSGFKRVFSGTFVRSSYRADEIFSS